MPFVPGQSGNTNGRPKGSGDVRLQIRKQLEARGEEVVATLLDMALVDRDPNAIKIIMERISPKPKSDSVNLGFDITKLDNQAHIRDIVAKTLLSAINGELPDDQGKSIASLAKTISDIDMQSKRDERLAAIERQLGIEPK
jgi:hypothetical protein